MMSVHEDEVLRSGAHHHLRITSKREIGHGIPCGAISLRKSDCSKFRSLMEAHVGRIGFKKVRILPGEGKEMALIHLSSGAAAALDDGEFPKCLSNFMASEDVRYFPGVRLHDRFFEEEKVIHLLQSKKNNLSPFDDPFTLF